MPEGVRSNWLCCALLLAAHSQQRAAHSALCWESAGSLLRTRSLRSSPGPTEADSQRVLSVVHFGIRVSNKSVMSKHRVASKREYAALGLGGVVAAITAVRMLRKQKRLRLTDVLANAEPLVPLEQTLFVENLSKKNNKTGIC